MIHNSLSIRVFPDGKAASEAGFAYLRPEYQPIKVKQVIIVQKGTVNENPTVDFILEAEDGQKYVFLVTGNLLKTLPI